MSHPALIHIRLAIHGWAFAHPDLIRKRLARAEKLKSQMPARLHPRVDEILQPLRNRLDNREPQS